jgi:hypothetical protein
MKYHNTIIMRYIKNHYTISRNLSIIISFAIFAIDFDCNKI